MIFVLDLFELALALFIILVIGTQIIVPFFRGTLMFPILRKEAKLEGELAEVREDIHVAELENKVAEERRKAATLRGKNVNAANQAERKEERQ